MVCSKGAAKNASDIQLTIDCMETLLSKNYIDTFIIISGDGGFSSLAKRINEHGKKVIGCAYKNFTNSIFPHICDDFIYIEQSLSEKQLDMIKESILDENLKTQIIQNPVLNSMLQGLNRIDTQDIAIKKEAILELIQEIKSDKEAQFLLNISGLNISIFKSALNYIIKDFNIIHFGFIKLADFIKYFLKDSGLKLVLKDSSDYRIVFDKTHLAGFEEVSFLEEMIDFNSEEYYKAILSNLKPRILIPQDKMQFQTVLDTIIDLAYGQNTLNLDMIIQNENINHIDEKSIKKIFQFLVSTTILLPQNETEKLSLEGEFYCKIMKQDVAKPIIINSIYDHLYPILKESLDKNKVEYIVAHLF